jgi:beta-galactosidase
LEAKAAYQPIRTSYAEGVLTVYNRLDFTDLEEYEFHYAIEADGKEIASEQLWVHAKPHTVVEVEIPYETQTCRFGAYLNVRLIKDGQVVAHTQHKLPFVAAETVAAPLAQLTEAGDDIIAEGVNFRYTFSKHYGAFTAMAVNGRQQLAARPVLTAHRAPTDNDRNIQYRWMQFNEWQGENLDKSSVKIYDCHVEENEIVVHGSLAGISRAPFFHFTQRVSVGVDGKVAVRLAGDIRKDTIWLPRLGYEFTLPGDTKAFAYYGNGPYESYRDLCHAGCVGLYESDTDKEYVPYVRPQEHGNHTAVKWLRIGDLTFAADEMEIQVSAISADALTKAQHTDELVRDGNTHLRIDYKVSGLGSNSCGPDLEKVYRLEEKQISFRYEIYPTEQ